MVGSHARYHRRSLRKKTPRGLLQLGKQRQRQTVGADALLLRLGRLP